MTDRHPGSQRAVRGAADSEQSETERRFVRSEDPSLSPEANRLLTEELQAVVGREEVEVPVGTPQRARERHGRHSSIVATLISNRAIVLVSFFAAVVVGGIISLATGEFWAVLVAVGLHAIGTMVVTAGAVQLTTQVEHVGPEVAARLEQEGVGDSDRVLSELVEDFAGASQAGGVSEVISSANNERTVAANDDPAKAMLEQRTALTPQSSPGGSAGEGSAIEALPWWVVVGMMAASVIGAPFLHHGWALPLIIVPIGLGWIALQAWMARSQRAVSRRAPGDTTTAARRLIPIGVFVVVAVIWLMVVLQWLTDYV
jgi:hypothetical protein